ncbi:MAG: protein-export chaperone SecB [Maricaulis sp.]|jgi:preprotein translocase subunit SecB|uniref:protein-export chaperone SecB n=1 Tax=Maricaulis sp. TaxID=1486257 RepID=UPI001B24D18A|nr:protein-export chaperone SecB [Maricaulis sp.]MBO6730167.1 protein-export chaperone SecB [Maricaulis sp.]MBO6846230.1 protein-export chaperone SecB [Maricaulis sp.]MBO6875893.1 protein-export chaperone SecB [Maricaulis sp.]MDM7985626.1 protein-export chaperone SecB [Maricaulis sp.]
MADAPTTPAEGEMPKVPSLRILTQFIKDLSFENPSFTEATRSQKPPNIDLGIDVQARTLSPDTYEVTLNFSARAVAEDEAVVFIAELAYAGVFQMANISDADREPFLLIECPRMIFPFARRILADVTRDGGFPPLMLDPVDFANLYRAQLAKRAAAAQGAETNGNGDPAAAN